MLLGQLVRPTTRAAWPARPDFGLDESIDRKRHPEGSVYVGPKLRRPTRAAASLAEDGHTGQSVGGLSLPDETNGFVPFIPGIPQLMTITAGSGSSKRRSTGVP